MPAKPSLSPTPLSIAKELQVTQEQIALRLRVTPDWLRHLVRKPQHSRRVLVAVLEAALQQERAALLDEGWLTVTERVP